MDIRWINGGRAGACFWLSTSFPANPSALPSFRFGRWRHLVGQQRSCTCVVPALDRLARPGEAQSFPPIGNGPQTSHSQAATLGGTDGAQFHQHSLFAPPAFFS